MEIDVLSLRPEDEKDFHVMFGNLELLIQHQEVTWKCFIIISMYNEPKLHRIMMYLFLCCYSWY